MRVVLRGCVLVQLVNLEDEIAPGIRDSHIVGPRLIYKRTR